MSGNRSIDTPPHAASAVDGGGLVRAADRTITLIRLLAEERRPLGLGEMAELAALPRATVHRLLATLIDADWVEQSRHTQKYRLGAGILGTAAIALAHATLIEYGRSMLARVADIAGLDGWISVLVGRRVTFLARGTPAGARSKEFHLGVTQPAHCTAAGKVLMAFLDPAERRHRYRNVAALRRYTAATITDWDAWEREMTLIAERGYALDTGEFMEHWRSAAVPVRGDGGAVIAALSCGGPHDQMTPDLARAMADEMTILAEDLSRRLGLAED